MLRELLHHGATPFSVVFDIGSGSVGVAVLELDPAQEKPLIVYTYREPIRPPKSSSPEHYIRALKEALLAATLELTTGGTKALREHGGSIHAMHILYAAPWSEVVSRAIYLEKPEPFKATQALVDNLVLEALKTADEHRSETLIFDRIGLEIVQQELMSGRLNGYTVSEFSGQLCTTVDLIHVSELVPHAVREAVHDAGRHFASHGTVSENAFARASSRAVHHIFPYTDSFLLVECTGGATECIIVEHGVPRESVSSMVGTHAFETEVAERLGTIDTEVRAHIRDYARETTHTEVTEALTEARGAYTVMLTKLFEELKTRYVLPRNIVTLAFPDYRELFFTMVEEAYAPIVDDYKIHTLDDALLKPFVVYGDGVTEDQYIAMIALFFHTKRKNESALLK